MPDFLHFDISDRNRVLFQISFVNALPFHIMMLTPHFSVLDAAYQLHFYLCFKTHHLQPLFVGSQHRNLITNVIDQVCSRQEYHLLDSRITPDYLRLLLSLKPDQTVSRAVKMLKGNLSREFAQSMSMNSVWARGYFARSAGKVNLDVARSYVESQASHHGYKGTWTKPLSIRNPAFKSPAFQLEHCQCMLTYHVVLTTKRRTSLFDETIAPGLFGHLLAVGQKHGFAIERMGLLPDHLHLIIEAVPNLSVEGCVLAILNNTHHWMTRRYTGVLKETDAWDVWQPSFYAGTVGTYSTAQMKRFLGTN